MQDVKKPQIVYMVMRWNKNRYRYSTKFKVMEKDWDNKKGLFHKMTSKTTPRNIVDIDKIAADKRIDESNLYLAEIKKAVSTEYYDLLKKNTIPTKEHLKSFLDKWTGRIVEEKPNFWNFIRQYIEDSPKRLDPRTGKFIGYRTIQEYKTTENVLKEFEKENNEKIDFDNININTLIDFNSFLTTVKKIKRVDKKTKQIIELPYSLNNIAKHLDNFKQFLRAAASKKIAFDMSVLEDKESKPIREESYNVYLNKEELKVIEKLVLDPFSRLDKARDLFLLGCYTGMRVSDYNNLKPHNIKEETIDVFQAKTGIRTIIPIHRTVKKILSKYSKTGLPKLSNQKLNDYIKEVCQKAGIEEHSEKQTTKGGAKVSIVKPKYEMVSTHTARRSFASNMVRDGLPIASIMAITGHTKETTFRKYVKLSNQEHADILAKHFQKMK